MSWSSPPARWTRAGSAKYAPMASDGGESAGTCRPAIMLLSNESCSRIFIGITLFCNSGIEPIIKVERKRTYGNELRVTLHHCN